MARLTWDDVGKREYETGCDRGVLYKPNSEGKYLGGVAWNGLTACNENPEGGDATDLYANNSKYLSLIAAEKYGFTIEAYTYPDEFEECDGSKEIAPGVYAGQQTRKPFGFTFRTLLGNDTEGDEHGYKIVLAYGCKASPSSKDHATVNDSPEAATMSWDVSTTPVPAGKEGLKPTASLTIKSTKVAADKLKALEDILYGTAEAEPRLPLPEEVITIIGALPEAAG